MLSTLISPAKLVLATSTKRAVYIPAIVVGSPDSAAPTLSPPPLLACAVGTDANRNSAFLSCVDAAGGTDSTISGDAKLMVRGRGAGPSH